MVENNIQKIDQKYLGNTCKSWLFCNEDGGSTFFCFFINKEIMYDDNDTACINFFDKYFIQEIIFNSIREKEETAIIHIGLS